LTKINWAQLKSDIGGAALLKRSGYLFAIPTVVLASVLVSNANQEAGAWLPWLLANALSLLLCWGWFELFERVIFANRAKRPIHFTWIVVFGLTLGGLKGAGTGFFGYQLGLEQDLAWAVISRVVQTAFLGLWLVPTITILEATRRRFQTERDALVAERVQQRLAAAGVGAGLTASNSIEHITQLQLREFVGEAKKRIGSEPSSTLGPLIRDIVENALRPLSHRLWERENARVANFSLTELSKIALVRYPFTLALVLPVYLTPIFISLISALGFQNAVFRTMVYALVLLAVLGAAKLFRPQRVTVAAGYFVAVLTVAALAIALAARFIFGDPFDAFLLSSSLVTLVWLVQATFFSAYVVAAVRSHDKIREQLEELERTSGNKSISASVVKTENLMLNRELANFLHGNLQNRLLSAALRLDKNQDNPENLVRELRAVEQLLDAAIVDYEQVNSLGLADQLAEIANRWAGFVSVKLDLKAAVADPNEIKRLNQLVNEAVSNAVRHGLASNVLVSLTRASGEGSNAGSLILTVTDDGLGPRDGSGGLGLQLYESLAGKNWSLNPGADGGSVLTLTLP
jgi:signal transduction histidine kinase